jgi:oligopeptide transport system substrate-binding protein
VQTVEFVRSSIMAALKPYGRGELDVITVRYTPRLADLLPGAPPPDAKMGAAAWSAYVAFDHHHPANAQVDFRRALAHAIDRAALAGVAPGNLIVADGGLVPPALQGHTPDIALRFDPDLARRYLERSGVTDPIEVGAIEVWDAILRTVAQSWESVLGLTVNVRSWTWKDEVAAQMSDTTVSAPITIKGWLPGYPDPEYFLRLLLHSDSKTNEGGFTDPRFDELIERARQERSDRDRLELFHEADRMAVADRVAIIPLVYARNVAFVKPWVSGWWEFGKTSASFADLVVEADRNIARASRARS